MSNGNGSEEERWRGNQRRRQSIRTKGTAAETTHGPVEDTRKYRTTLSPSHAKNKPTESSWSEQMHRLPRWTTLTLFTVHICVASVLLSAFVNLQNESSASQQNVKRLMESREWTLLHFVNQSKAIRVKEELESAHEQLRVCDQNNRVAKLIVSQAYHMVETHRQRINYEAAARKVETTGVAGSCISVCPSAARYERKISKMRQEQMATESALAEATSLLRRTRYKYEQLKARADAFELLPGLDLIENNGVTHSTLSNNNMSNQRKPSPAIVVKEGPNNSKESKVSQQYQQEQHQEQRTIRDRNILTVGIPTIARRKQADYLRTTLYSIYTQLITTGLWPLVRVVVMHSHPDKRHDVYDDCKKEFANNLKPAARSFVFVDNVRVGVEDVALHVSRSASRRPDRRVRRQTRDIVSLLGHVVEEELDTKWFLFMEDDFVMCNNALLASWHYLHRATLTVGDFSALRSSFGMNGIFMSARDLPAFATYLHDSQARRPPDHLAVEWYAKETEKARQVLKDRVLVSTRSNLFLHIGTVSTLRHKRAHNVLPKCWEHLKPPVVFEVEAFREQECAGEDLWPCPPLLAHPISITTTTTSVACDASLNDDMSAWHSVEHGVASFASSAGMVNFGAKQNPDQDTTRSTTFSVL